MHFSDEIWSLIKEFAFSFSLFDAYPADSLSLEDNLSLSVADKVTCLTYCPRRSLIITSGWDKLITIWYLTADSAKIERTIGTDSTVLSLAVDEEEEFLVAGLNANSISVFLLASGENLYTFRAHRYIVSGVVVSGNSIISTSYDKKIKVWELYNGELLMTLHYLCPILCVAANDEYIVTGSTDCKVKVWSCETGDSVDTLEGHQGHVISVAVNNAFFVSGDNRGAVYVWSSPSGTLLRSLEGHTSSVHCIKISKSKIFTAGADRTIRMWSAETAELLKSLKSHEDIVRAIAINGEGYCKTFIVSGGGDRKIKVWKARYESKFNVQDEIENFSKLTLN